MIKNMKQGYIRHANTLEDVAHGSRLNCKYTVGLDNVSLEITKEGEEKKLFIVCMEHDHDKIKGGIKYKKKEKGTLIIVTDNDMLRIAIDDIRKFASTTLV